MDHRPHSESVKEEQVSNFLRANLLDPVMFQNIPLK